MDFLPPAFDTLKLYNQFIVYNLTEGNPKKIKRPANYKTGATWDAHDSSIWVDSDTAIASAKRLGSGYGVGFVFTDKDPFFLLDIDSAYEPKAGWSDLSKSLLNKLAGAAVEVSASGKGLHIIGTTKPFEHGCRNDNLGLELYTSKRFVALTGIHAQGNSGMDCTNAIQEIANQYLKFDKKAVSVKDDETMPEWVGPEDDDELLAMALKSKSIKAKFGNSTTATFADLWNNNEQVLGTFFPPDANSNEPYNRSRADAALAQHLAWWTGCNSERMLRMMKRSKLYREKWDREDYLPRTIRAARGNTTNCLIMTQTKNSTIQTDSKQVELVRTSTNFLTPQEQVTYFQGNVYICEDNQILVPGGYRLDRERFNTMKGGPIFIMDHANAKTTNKAWDAATLGASSIPKVNSSTFRPDLEPGIIIEKDGELLVNSYWPYRCKRVKGDVSPFLYHLEKLFPDERDREIVLCYLAALIQYPGRKFKWCIVLQGTQGNGKTFLSRIITFTIGDRYTQYPRADQIGSNFNDWQENTIFVCIEEAYYPEGRAENMEILKTMVDLTRVQVEGKGRKKVMRDVCFNMMINTNHKEGLRKSKDDRRFAIFYTPQQCVEDLRRDGMTDGYFRDKIYGWADNKDGYAKCAEFLYTYNIRDEFNPLLIERAPFTSTTEQAISHGKGRVEHEIEEAVESERVGFKGGWICSTPLDSLFKEIGADKRIPHNKRRELLKSLGYDWHPHLKDGRVTTIMPGENSKPRLYIKDGHKDRNITDPQKIIQAYKDAQK